MAKARAEDLMTEKEKQAADKFDKMLNDALNGSTQDFADAAPDLIETLKQVPTEDELKRRLKERE